MPALRLAHLVLTRIAIAAGCGLGAIGALVGLRRPRCRWLALTVSGDDMAPTFRAGQRVLARRVRSTGADSPERADLVVFRPASALSYQLESSDLPLRVARVVAASGEIGPGPDGAEPGRRVPPGKLLVVGDGRDAGAPALIDADDVVGIIGG